jgi:hypothetical protein
MQKFNGILLALFMVICSTSSFADNATIAVTNDNKTAQEEEVLKSKSTCDVGMKKLSIGNVYFINDSSVNILSINAFEMENDLVKRHFAAIDVHSDEKAFVSFTDDAYNKVSYEKFTINDGDDLQYEFTTKTRLSEKSDKPSLWIDITSSKNPDLDTSKICPLKHSGGQNFNATFKYSSLVGIKEIKIDCESDVTPGK